MKTLYVIHGWTYTTDPWKNTIEILKKEYGITDSDMLAVMTSFVHRGKEHSVSERGYRFYSRFIVFIHPLVSLKLRARSFLGRVYRRLFKKSASAGSRGGKGGAGGQ